MLNWTFKQWISQPGRAFLVIIVFAGVLSLSMLFDGIRIGIEQDMAEFPQSLQADLVAINSGNSYFAMGPSSLPRQVLTDIRAVPDVAEADPIGMVPFILSHAGERTPSMLIAYGKVGGPPNLVEGRKPGLAPEIVIDQNLARLHGLSLGDNIKVLGASLKVVGISSGTTSPFTPYAFVSYDQFVLVAAMMAMSAGPNADMPKISLVSAVMIKIADGADLEQVRAALESAVTDADFFTPNELGAADAGFVGRMLGPVLILLAAMAWLITWLTMAMLRHAEVQFNLHQFGIQKALGVKPGGLALALVAGGVLIALSSFPLALLAAKGLAWLMSDWNPLYNPRVWDLGVMARALAVSLVAVVVSVYFPWRRLVRLEPVMVFSR